MELWNISTHFVARDSLFGQWQKGCRCDQIRPWASSGIKDPLPLMAASGAKYSHHFLSAYGKNMNA